MNEQKNSLSVVTILPPPSQSPGSIQMAQGTKVMLSDGSELARVHSVELKAEAGGAWKAIITVWPEIIQPVNAEVEIVEVDITDMKAQSRTYARFEA
ncbi:hypothetical protein [Pseudomonas taetrolens]|uniref:hypothetical protein n=1 Tax=Pseudomonas taetrolens TaxID=47884 RepID=UPI003F99F1CB